jgi:hypothetical protein
VGHDGHLYATNATITGGSITIKNGDNTVFSASPSGVTIGGVASDNYAKKDDIPSLDNYATKNEIPDVSGFATKGEIPDVSGFMNKEAKGFYSWKFDPNKNGGIFMWNGIQDDNNLVFGVNSDGVYTKGEVVANKGRIG